MTSTVPYPSGAPTGCLGTERRLVVHFGRAGEKWIRWQRGVEGFSDVLCRARDGCPFSVLAEISVDRLRI